MIINRISVVVLFASVLTVFGFSPYEEYLQSGRQTHVALLAKVKTVKGTELQNALNTLKAKKAAKGFRKVKISEISSYSFEYKSNTWVMVYFDYDGDGYLKAAEAFESVSQAKVLTKFLTAHPRAKRYGTTWLQMEWICYIAGSQKKGPATSKFAMVTKIKPEKEKEYRLLHQTVWPGVVDQMVRGNNRDFSIFIAEIGDEIFEIFHLDYVGDDAEKDGKMNQVDPFNIRWWKHTDACQTPLPGVDGIWKMMDKKL